MDEHSARRGPGRMLDFPLSRRHTLVAASEVPPENAVEDLAQRYALPGWFADQLVDRLGYSLARRRCELAACRWRLLILHLTGRNLRGISDLGKLRQLYEAECGRLRSAERVDAAPVIRIVEDPA